MAVTVILPLDRSEFSEGAIPVARELAARVGAEIVLLSVIEAPSHLAEWATFRNSDEVVEGWTRQWEEVTSYLDEVKERFSGLDIETHTMAGNPVRKVNELAQHVENPVIVMASHGRSALQRMRLGSVSAGVVQSSTCPVIVVRPGDEDSVVSFDRLLVALDGSHFAEEALAAIQAVLGISGQSLHLLRVVETAKVIGGSYSSFRYSGIEYYLDALHDEATEYLENVANELTTAGHDVSWEVRDGAVAEEIEQAAKEQRAGLVVMSTHGRSGLQHILLGSVADRVVNHSRLPIFVVRPAG